MFFGAAPYLLKQKVPVTGTGIDGPEWSVDSNLFDAYGPATGGPIAGHLWTTTATASFFKSLGANKVAGVSANTPSATDGVDAVFDTFPKAGLSKCYFTTVPLGGINVTTNVLAIKNAGCNALYDSNVDATDIAFGQGLKNAGVKLKATFLAEGYDNTVLDNAVNRAAVQGDYFAGSINFTQPNAPTKSMLAALRKYDKFAGGIPDLGLYGGWEAADLMIFGLEHAGASPTPSSFMSNLHHVASYDAGGILPSSWGFTHFGTAQMVPKTGCTYFFQMEGSDFVVANKGKPYCGAYVETAVP